MLTFFKDISPQTSSHMANFGKTGIWPNLATKMVFLKAFNLQRGEINFFHHSEANTFALSFVNRF